MQKLSLSMAGDGGQFFLFFIFHGNAKFGNAIIVVGFDF